MENKTIFESLKMECLRRRIDFTKKTLEDICAESEERQVEALQLLEAAVKNGKLEQIPIPEEIEFYEPSVPAGNLLVIAPHAVIYNDDNTAPLARKLAVILNGYYIINEKFRKPFDDEEADPDNYIVNLNDTRQFNDEIRHGFLTRTKEIISTIRQQHSRVLVLLIHGIAQRNISQAARNLISHEGNPDELDILLGFGQNKNDANRLTISDGKLANDIVKSLRNVGIIAAGAPLTPIDENRSYCAYAKWNLNQELGNPQEGIQSIQLEIRKKRLRRNPHIAAKAGELLAKAFKPFIYESQNSYGCNYFQ